MWTVFGLKWLILRVDCKTIAVLAHNFWRFFLSWKSHTEQLSCRLIYMVSWWPIFHLTINRDISLCLNNWKFKRPTQRQTKNPSNMRGPLCLKPNHKIFLSHSDNWSMLWYEFVPQIGKETAMIRFFPHVEKLLKNWVILHCGAAIQVSRKYHF